MELVLKALCALWAAMKEHSENVETVELYYVYNELRAQLLYYSDCFACQVITLCGMKYKN